MPKIKTTEPRVAGARTWAASFLATTNSPAGLTRERLETWFTNCLRDGYAQGRAAAQ